MTALEEIKKALEGVTPGPWHVYSEKVADKAAAIAESAYQVEHTEPFVGEIFMLNAGGKCPALTGCGPCSEANARYIAAVNPEAISELLSTLESLQRENEELTSGIKRLSDEEELLAETTGDMVSVVKLAAKLALSETHVNELQKANVAYVDANTALIRENEALKKDRDFWKEQFQVETRYRIELADRGTLLALTDANSRAEAAEAEAKMLREALHKIESGYGANDICARIARDALSAQVQDVAAKSLADAYQKYLDASDLYNERLAISKTKALGTMRVDEEYRAIDEARRAFDKLAVDIAKSALPAAPAKQEG